jgi:dipeptidyl aminopeptidase/acylaminoacyl peptidase
LSVVGQVAWGPDNQTLYFVGRSNQQPCPPDDIERFNYVTGELTAPYPIPASAMEHGVDCRPDGRYLSVERSGGGSWWIDCIDTAAGAERPRWHMLAPSGTTLAWSRWSPDGRYIAYQRTNPSPKESDICVFDTATSKSRDLVTGPTDDKYPDWTPDSQWVLFCRGATLYRVLVGGGAPEQLKRLWGLQPDSWAPSYDRWRSLIGGLETDWGGANPPFGTAQQAAIVAVSSQELAAAVGFWAGTSNYLYVTDLTPGTGTSAVVAAVSGNDIQVVYRDEGAGIAPTVLRLGDEPHYPPEVLAVFSAETAQLTSVIPVWPAGGGVTEAGLSAPGVRVEQSEASLAITGAQMQVYDARGTLLSGAAPLRQVTLDSRTGRFLAP